MGFKSRFRKFLQRPGTTVDLGPFERRLAAIEAREEALQELDDAALTAAAGDATDYIEICAIGREAARRALGERPFDVQLLGAMAMLSGNVAEMATGEGKTLAAAIAAYGHVRLGNGPVHVLTVNDYLARRDADLDGAGLHAARPHRRLGHRVVHAASERREAYGNDVTYVSVNEAGFDYLRDQLVTDVADRVQRAARHRDRRRGRLDPHRRGPGADGAGRHGARRGRIRCTRPPRWSRGLRPGKDFEVADDGRSVALTTAGLAAVEKQLGGINLYDEEHIEPALRGQRRAARPGAAAPRRRLHRARRHGRAGRRDARPGGPAPPLAGRPAGRGGGQGGPRRHRRGRGARHHHRAGLHRRSTRWCAA